MTYKIRYPRKQWIPEHPQITRTRLEMDISPNEKYTVRLRDSHHNIWLVVYANSKNEIKKALLEALPKVSKKIENKLRISTKDSPVPQPYNFYSGKKSEWIHDIDEFLK